MGLFSRRRKSARAASSPPASTTAAPSRPAFTQSLALAKLNGDWIFDPAHSSVGFAARHAMVTRVRGIFNEFEGRMHLDGERPWLSAAEVVIQVASVDTRVEQRDAHLRSADFFDVERFPLITFRSTSAEQVGEDLYRMTGDLTVKNQTHPVTVDLLYSGSVVDAFGVERVGFDGSTVINRTHWGLTWNAALETGGMLVSEKIKLEFDISAIRMP
jgi:polyisoprenoid-binding protein YceI